MISLDEFYRMVNGKHRQEGEQEQLEQEERIVVSQETVNWNLLLKNQAVFPQQEDEIYLCRDSSQGWSPFCKYWIAKKKKTT